MQDVRHCVRAAQRVPVPEDARKERGAKIVAVDIYMNGTMEQADLPVLIRPGTDAALACADVSELKRVADALSAAGIENTGAKRDETLGKDYVAFKDPDRIAWEFYMA